MIAEAQLFNQEIKMQFINIYDNASTKNDYRLVFQRTEFFESTREKDLFKFNYDELKDMLVGLQCTTPKALDHVKSVVSKYLKWANKEGYSENYVDITKFVTRSSIYENVSNYAITEQYIFSRDELYALADFCVNTQDAVLFILPYEGARGKQLEEIRNLRVKDVHPTKALLEDQDFSKIRSSITAGNNTIVLSRTEKTKTTTRTIEISEASMRIILEAIAEEEYYKKNGEIDTGVTAPVYEIIPTPYVVRYTGRRNKTKDVRVEAQIINKRITKMAELMEKPELTPTTIFYSGLLNYLKQIENTKGSLTNEDFKETQVRYGLNSERFWDTKDLYESLKDRLK